MTIISDIITVIDKIQKLKTYKKSNLKQIFDGIIEPTFNDLIIIQTDYLKILISLRDSLKYGKLDIEQLASRLRKERLEFEPVRAKVKSVSHQLKFIRNNEKVYHFIEALINYLPCGELFGEDPSSSTKILDLLDNHNPDLPLYYNNVKINPKDKYIEILDITIDKIRADWSILCESYAKLKTNVI